MAHDIDDNITNSCINFCISEYVRLSEHQRILRDKWFEGLSFEELSAKYHLSVNRIKKIVMQFRCPFVSSPFPFPFSFFLQPHNYAVFCVVNNCVVYLFNVLTVIVFYDVAFLQCIKDKFLRALYVVNIAPRCRLVPLDIHLARLVDFAQRAIGDALFDVPSDK